MTASASNGSGVVAEWATDSNYRARRIKNKVMTVLMLAALAVTVGALAWVLLYVALQGFKYLNVAFLIKTPPGSPAQGGGGFYNGIVGTIIIVGIAFAVAAPLGVLVAVYLVEYGRGRTAATVRFLADVLVGVPSIVVGAFIYAIWVLNFGFSGLAGALSLSIVMLPLIIRSAEEVILLVPRDLREASYALGVPKWKTTLRITLPTARNGILTGMMLAVARAAGETAPLILTALGNDLFTEYNPLRRMSTLSLLIFHNATTGFKPAQARAWAGALVLIIMILSLTLASRWLSGRRERTMGGAGR